MNQTNYNLSNPAIWLRESILQSEAATSQHRIRVFGGDPVVRREFPDEAGEESELSLGRPGQIFAGKGLLMTTRGTPKSAGLRAWLVIRPSA